MQVDSLADIGSGSLWIRDANGILQQTTTQRITRDDRMPELLDAIAAGRVYALWNHRYQEFDELGPEWPTRGHHAVPETGTSA
jgi:hypothetical protein